MNIFDPGWLQDEKGRYVAEKSYELKVVRDEKALPEILAVAKAIGAVFEQELVLVMEGIAGELHEVWRLGYRE